MTSDQFGSRASDLEYETEVHTFIASASFMPMSRLSLTGNLAYSVGTGEIDDGPSFSAADGWPADAKLDFDVSALNPNQQYLYDLTYVNGIDDYSDLDFTQLDVSLGAGYRLTDSIGLSLNYYYTDVQDDEPYVYDDQSGDVQSVMGYVTYRF
jgi:predicted porin